MKHWDLIPDAKLIIVAPRAGAWIETGQGLWSDIDEPSLPARERGLKRLTPTGDRKDALSLPARERGLKPDAIYISLSEAHVAPRAGAWIETNPLSAHTPNTTSRSPRGSVD